jgi:hypothetical protein
MNLILRRLRNNGGTTIGQLKDGFINMLTLEDEPREVKVMGETRIPAGTFEIKERKIISPKTEHYRKKYHWFNYHLMLQDVPGFNYVYIHIGNDDDDTEGCILVGEKEAYWKIEQSTSAFTRLYHYIMGAITAGERVFISIIDEDGN